MDRQLAGDNIPRCRLAGAYLELHDVPNTRDLLMAALLEHYVLGRVHFINAQVTVVVQTVLEGSDGVVYTQAQQHKHVHL